MLSVMIMMLNIHHLSKSISSYTHTHTGARVHTDNRRAYTLHSTHILEDDDYKIYGIKSTFDIVS